MLLYLFTIKAEFYYTYISFLNNFVLRDYNINTFWSLKLSRIIFTVAKISKGRIEFVRNAPAVSQAKCSR